MKKTFDFPGFKDDVEVGSIFQDRVEELEAGLHNSNQYVITQPFQNDFLWPYNQDIPSLQEFLPI